MSIFAGGTDALVQLLAQRKLEQRQAMLDSIALASRKDRLAHEQRQEAREDARFQAEQGDRQRRLADEDRARTETETLQRLTAMRQGSLNAEGTTMQGMPEAGPGGDTRVPILPNPMGAQATRDAINVALRIGAPGGGALAEKYEKADTDAASTAQRNAATRAYLANPTPQGAAALKVMYDIDVPKPEKRELINVSPGTRVLDPNTGEVVYTAPREPREARQESWSAPIETEMGLVQISSSGQVRQPLGPGGAPLRKTGGAADKFTEGQSNAATFAARMEDAGPILDKHETYAASSASRMDQVPYQPNEWKSAAAKEYEPAKIDFISAVLRKESGAAISPSEFANADRQYFPQPGDPPQAVRDKKARRATATESMRRAAGGAARRSTGQPGLAGVTDAAAEAALRAANKPITPANVEFVKRQLAGQ